MIHSSGSEVLTNISNAIINGNFVPEVMEQTIISTQGQILGAFNETNNSSNPFNEWTEDSIAIIPLYGVMMKYGYWWSYGVDDIATIIRLAYQSENISAVILKMDTPGGSTDSLFLLQEVLSEKTKPTYGFVDGMCASCGYIVASYLDKLYAINPMARIGSIGVMAQIVIPNKENARYQIIEVYPDESKDKNLPERQAVDGNQEPLKEQLAKLAIHFQDIVKENRPGINPEVLSGKMYYAYEAESLGMIDGVRTLTQVISELEILIAKRKEILSIL
ncbi:S49 family peptidase [Paludibacter sp. 221]|uniref:S49 family peptidase n=1 Tax=Paludibacter sp. 221 TaxID=2302939 RepID=UPI0013D87956|nr:S49 family peptidase [Paludibacter sp. 221]